MRRAVWRQRPHPLADAIDESSLPFDRCVGLMEAAVRNLAVSAIDHHDHALERRVSDVLRISDQPPSLPPGAEAACLQERGGEEVEQLRLQARTSADCPSAEGQSTSCGRMEPSGRPKILARPGLRRRSGLCPGDRQNAVTFHDSEPSAERTCRLPSDWPRLRRRRTDRTTVVAHASEVFGLTADVPASADAACEHDPAAGTARHPHLPATPGCGQKRPL